MAFNAQTFRTRALTSVVFVIVMLAGLLWNAWSFFILFSIIHFGCWIEYQRLVEKIDNNYRQIGLFHRYGVMVIGWGFIVCFWGIIDRWIGYNHQYLMYAYGSLMLVFIIIELLIKKTASLKNIAYSLFGVIYISLSLGLMTDLRGAGVGISCMNGGGITGTITVCNHFIFPFVIIPLTIIFSIWINDTMAYLVGSLIGKHPLSKISPKKTWEGTIGGILLAVAAAGYLFSHLDPTIVIPGFHYDLPNYIWYVIPLIAAIAGTFGDLLESKLKRMAGVKDSGSIMPGHGGFLDRFDSLLVATPFVWLYIHFFI